MNLGYALTLRLTAGLQIDAEPPALKCRFEVAWGKTEVFVTHATGWEVTFLRSWAHSAHWAIRMAAAHAAPYGLRLESASLYPYDDLRQHWRAFVLRYDEMPWARARHVTRYSDLGTCRRSLRLPYWLTEPVAVRHGLGYAITKVDPVVIQLTVSWSLLRDARLQAVVNRPEMTWNGRTIRIMQATLSCDEDSPVWMAQVEIAELADFAAIGIGETITLALGLETFVLVVDGKTLSRESVAERSCALSAVSPVALRDAPFAGTIRLYQPDVQSAQTAVEKLLYPYLEPAGWQLPHWMIPAGRLMLEGVTPLAAARNIVAAIGGIVESNPDGSVVCRRRHPVRIPQYAAATVAHSLFDTDVISTRAQIAPSRGFNRVTIANEEGVAGSSADRIEFVADADDDNSGTVRATLFPPRPVVLTHTGHAATVIASLGEVSRTEVETVEFVEGRASTRYPVQSITSTVWQHTDLGAVSADGQSLLAATPGFSLLCITYTVTSRNWRVALPINEEVQFVLVDA